MKNKKYILQHILQKIVQYLYTIYTKCSNIIFPIECISCQKPDTLICYDCLSNIHTRFNNSKLESGLEVYAAYGFSIPIVRKLITRAKYYHSPIIFEELTLHAIPTLSPIFLIQKTKKIILIPVPLHFIRFQKRGFNQSNIIAQTLADTFQNTEVIPLIKRIKHTPQQAKLNKINRIKNIKNSFCLDTQFAEPFISQISKHSKTSQSHIQEYTFMIIDDVISTGSTVVEITTVLKKELNIPQKNIIAVSLCRG